MSEVNRFRPGRNVNPVVHTPPISGRLWDQEKKERKPPKPRSPPPQAPGDELPHVDEMA